MGCLSEDTVPFHVPVHFSTNLIGLSLHDGILEVEVLCSG